MASRSNALASDRMRVTGLLDPKNRSIASIANSPPCRTISSNMSSGMPAVYPQRARSVDDRILRLLVLREHVGPFAAVEVIGVRAAIEGVVVGAGGELVDAGVAEELVHAGAAREGVGANAA